MSRRMTALGLTVALVTITVGVYAIFKQQTPVSLERAVARFREENDETTSGTRKVAEIEREPKKDRAGRSGSKPKTKKPAGQPTQEPGPGGLPEPPAQDPRGQPPTLIISAPAEGVYGYTGSGSETFGVVGRDFPSSSWRAITHQDRNTWDEHHFFSEEREYWTQISRNTWDEHHFFSEEREYWTQISTGSKSRLAHAQRHYIRIGGYEQKPGLTLRPPLPSAELPPEVGQKWNGVTNGYGDDGEEVRVAYECTTFERRVWEIDGRRIVTWGVLIDAVLTGDYEGTLTVRRWFSPSHGLNVREEYYADVDLGPITYIAEWSVTIRSLTPKT